MNWAPGAPKTWRSRRPRSKSEPENFRNSAYGCSLGRHWRSIGKEARKAAVGKEPCAATTAEPGQAGCSRSTEMTGDGRRDDGPRFVTEVSRRAARGARGSQEPAPLRDDLRSRKAVSTGIKRNRSRSPWDVLAELVTSEGAERKVRSNRHQLAIAKFPLTKALTGVDFARSPVNEMMVCDLHEGHFMEAARNVVFVGGPRSGKSLATAIGMNAIRTEPRPTRGFLRLPPDCVVPPGPRNPVSSPTLLKTS